MLPVPMLDKDCQNFGDMNLKKLNSFKCIQVHSKHGNFRRKEMIILSLNESLNTILSTDIYVALEEELCLPSKSGYF